MASTKRQMQSLQSAYEHGSMTRSLLDTISDKALRKILQDALSPWYRNKILVPGLGAAVIVAALYFWTKNLYLSVGIPGGTYLVWLAYNYFSASETEALGIVFTMWQLDEDRVRKLLNRVDADEHKLTKALTLGARQAMMKRLTQLEREMGMLRQRIQQLPAMLTEDAEFLRSGIKKLSSLAA